MVYDRGTESPTNAFAIRSSSAERRRSAHDIVSMRKNTAPVYFRSSAAWPMPGTSAEYTNARRGEIGGNVNGFSTRVDVCGTVSALEALSPTLSGFCAEA